MSASSSASCNSSAWCTIVVPCYNEAARLKTDAFAAFLAAPASAGIRFLFVNDGSSDNTLAVLHDFRQGREAHVLVHDQQPNGGKGEAVRNGMLAALALGDNEAIGFWDADLATPLDAIPSLLTELRLNKQIQMVFGSRVRLLGRAVHRKAVRHYLGRLFATTVSILLRLPVYDTQCGAKLFRATPRLGALLAEPFLSRWVFDVEILAREMRAIHHDPAALEAQVHEFPLRRWEDIAGSKVRPTDFLRAFVDLMRIWRRYLS